MLITDLNAAWHVVESIDAYSCQGVKGAREFKAGVKGYARRNSFDPDYFQVLMRDADGSIAGWYIKELKVTGLLIPLKPAPVNAEPGRHWSAFWSRYPRSYGLLSGAADKKRK